MNEEAAPLPDGPALKLSEGIHAFPLRHGKAPFAFALRALLWRERFDAIAVALPRKLRDETAAAAARLPEVQALALEVEGSLRCYLPLDPCDAYVEGIRQAEAARLPLLFTEDDTLFETRFSYSLPDAALLPALGIAGYASLARSLLSSVEDPHPLLRHRALVNYRALSEAYAALAAASRPNLAEAPAASPAPAGTAARAPRLLLLADFPLVFELEKLFEAGSIDQILSETRLAAAFEEKELEVAVEAFPVNPRHLYFALGEIPFYAAELERERQDPFAPPSDYLDFVKKVFSATRDHYRAREGEVELLPLGKLRIALKFLRNLACQQGRLTPDLADIVTAAKGVFGPAFAVKALEALRAYPFNAPRPETQIDIGRDAAQRPQDEEPLPAYNLFEDEKKVWKTLRLRPEPDPRKQRDYRYAWDPRGMCSHSPEDDRIEGFNRTVRRRASEISHLALARTEKMVASLKDGVDLRETLRQWHTGRIHVREIPPDRGKVDTVVILFDTDHDEHYPQRTTWYAEHAEESTLTFYASNPLDKLIGPGIAEARYGGLSLLFPPRPVPDIFSLFPTSRFQCLADQLLYGALLHSREKTVTVVSLQKPNLRQLEMARSQRKRLLHVPLHSFSSETLRKLRTFHILNGKEVRAWASRYIPE